MADRSILQEAINQFRQSHDRMRGLADSGDPDWKGKLVNARRDLQSCISSIGNAVSHEPSLANDSDRRERFRARLSAMRSVVALHQANWPVVTIESDKSAYGQSVANVSAACAEFLSIANEIIG